MRYLLFLLLIITLTSEKCKSKLAKSSNSGLPACLLKKIEDASKESPATPPLQVDEYEFRGKKVYLWVADCCDFFNTLFDENCNSICAPSGGITGKGDMKCPDFESKAQFVKQVWKKP